MPEAIFQESTVLMGKKCKSCGAIHQDPVYACMTCGSDSLETIQFQGKGTIYTFTVVYVGFGHMAEKTPYVLGIVDLDEGLKVTCIVEGVTDFDSVAIGQKVEFLRIDPTIGSIFQRVS